MFKKIFSTIALLGMAGCSASMDMGNNRTAYRSDYDTNTNARTYDRTYDARVASDRDANVNVQTRTDTYDRNYNNRTDTYADRDNYDNSGPIWTDPVGRPWMIGRQISNNWDNNGRSSYTRTTYDSRSNNNYDNNRGMNASARVDSDGFATRNNTATNGDVTVRTDTSDARTANARVDVNANANDNTAKLSAQDRSFIDGAVSAGLFEVKSGQLIKDKLSDNDAKQFAQMMIDDHTKANNELKDLLSRRGINATMDMRPQHQTLLNNLQSMNGNDLWNQYKQIQVTAHEQTVKLFQDEINNGQDADLKAFAQKYLPVLQQHLEGAKAHMNMNDNMNK
jgi:putative membrane protein